MFLQNEILPNYTARSASMRELNDPSAQVVVQDNEVITHSAARQLTFTRKLLRSTETSLRVR